MNKILLIFICVILTTHTQAQKIKIKENSKIAKLAARINKSEKYAITIGRTIFINCSEEQFFARTWWVRHELTHVKQYKKHGIARFLAMYVFYSVFRNYSEIPFEKEAIAAEFSRE
jgi:hypothetical protein